MTSPTLSIVIPARTRTDPQLSELLDSIKRQSFPQDQLEVLVITEGNSEQAKAYGIQKAKGKYIGLFCADNYLRDENLLQSACWHLDHYPKLTGVYTAQYDYVSSDKALSRYFALLGANDPLCWWLGKADRQSYLQPPKIGTIKVYPEQIPSIGCNGFFVRSELMKKVVTNPDRHFPMDAVVDLIHSGHDLFYRLPIKVWHKSGESMLDYFRRRYVYTRDLYFRQKEKRRWHMVDSRMDWARSLLFLIGSLLVVPNLVTAIRGFRRVHDWSWFMHVGVSYCLSILYVACFLRWGLLRCRSSSVLTSVPIPLSDVSRV